MAKSVTVTNTANPSPKLSIHSTICDGIKELYRRKHSDYGDSFAITRHKYPNAICVRLLDKMNRLEKLLDPNYQQMVHDEQVEDTLLDIANYCIMELVEREFDLQQEAANG